MLRPGLAAALILVSLPALAQESGDFDCVSALNGPETPGGVLHVEREGDRGRFAFLDAKGNHGEWSDVDFIDVGTIFFDDALAGHFSEGAIMAEARWDAAAFAYAGTFITAGGTPVDFSCTFLP
jgi:hypothetical protein